MVVSGQVNAFDREDAPHQTTVHLHFLDGLRGVAALYVALYHTRMLVLGHGGSVHPSLITATSWMGFGHFSVDIFIVLSGFVLMLPVCRADDGRLSGGLVAFAVRRFRRIFPAYWAALLISTVIFVIENRLHLVYGSSLDKRSLLAHFFMVQNIRSDWARQIDGPLWSVGTEWDIYIVFAIVILPIWRFLGLPAAVITSFVLGIAPHFLLPATANFDWACPWYLGLFAMGMAGASICYGKGERAPRPGGERRWAFMGVSCICLVYAGMWMLDRSPGELDGALQSVVDSVVGLATISLIVYCTKLSVALRPGLLHRVLSSRVAVGLGAFSYSLYLIHQVLLTLFINVFAKYWSGTTLYTAAFLSLPVVLAITYLLYLAFEKPFLRTSTRASQA